MRQVLPMRSFMVNVAPGWTALGPRRATRKAAVFDFGPVIWDDRPETLMGSPGLPSSFTVGTANVHSNTSRDSPFTSMVRSTTEVSEAG
jgi:hypothetical protein